MSTFSLIPNLTLTLSSPHLNPPFLPLQTLPTRTWSSKPPPLTLPPTPTLTLSLPRPSPSPLLYLYPFPCPFLTLVFTDPTNPNVVLQTSTELFLAKSALDLVAVTAFMAQDKDKGPLLTPAEKDVLCQDYYYTKTALTEMKVG